MDRVNDSWLEEYYEDEDPNVFSGPVVQASPPRALRGSMCGGPNEDFDPISSSEKFTWLGATIELGRKTYCKGWAIYHPGNFFVVLRKCWNQLESHQEDIQKFFEKPVPGNWANKASNAVDDPRYKPEAKKLKCGQIVAVFHRKEWHRGMILKIFEKQAIYKVMIVDFGDHKNFELSMIRLLPQKFLKFPAQAIKCCLYFDGPGKALNGSRVEWSGYEATHFRTLMDPCMFYMEFVEYEVDWNLANPIIWRCRVQRILSCHDLNRMYQVEKRFVSDVLLKTLQKCYEDQKKKEKEEKMKKKMSKVPTVVPQNLWYSFMKTFSVTELAECKDLNESLSNFEGIFCSAAKLDEEENKDEAE